MDIRERYKIEETADSLVIYPHRHTIRLAWQIIIGIIPAAVILFFLRGLLTKEIWVSLYVIMAYGIVHSLYDIFIRSAVSYSFNKRTNAVCKTSLFAKNKMIIPLDEVVIFTNSETGSWCYKMGARKSQFIKNYVISEHFGGGKKSRERSELYETVILEKMNHLIHVC